ncbi:MAG: ferrochelatase [Chloroflexi bacterium]|nr:ferrochelatase [Chloroflexota bacterium]
MPTLGLLMLSHGAAERMDDIEAYYAHILHGRTPRPDRLQALRERYLAIGETSPLNGVTRRQGAQIAAALNRAGVPARAYVGFQHTPPFIGDAVQRLVADGVRQAVALVMTPYYSPLGVGRYLADVRLQIERAGEPVEVTSVESWDQEPEFLDLLEGRVRDALDAAGLEGASVGDGPCHVIFTAHSLPILAHNRDDPYADRFRAAARSLAARLRIERWSTCYQSASDNGLPWLGPDILEEVDRVHATGATRLVVCPSSFPADNLEVLYDVGIEAARRARSLGMAFIQTAPLNDDPALTGFLARMIARRLAHATKTAEPAASATSATPARPPEQVAAAAS